MSVCCCLLLLVGLMMSSSAQEIIQAPENKTVIIGHLASFTCETSGGFVGLTVNNSLLEDLDHFVLADISYKTKKFINKTTTVELSLRVRAQYNQTTIQCVVANTLNGMTLMRSAFLFTEESPNSIVPSSVVIGHGTIPSLLTTISPSVNRGGYTTAVVVSVPIAVVLAILLCLAIVLAAVIARVICQRRKKSSLATGIPAGTAQAKGFSSGANHLGQPSSQTASGGSVTSDGTNHCDGNVEVTLQLRGADKFISVADLNQESMSQESQELLKKLVSLQWDLCDKEVKTLKIRLLHHQS